MPLSKDRMREYQRQRRAKGLQSTITNLVKCKPNTVNHLVKCKPEDVNPDAIPCPDCIKYQNEIAKLQSQPYSKTKHGDYKDLPFSKTRQAQGYNI